MQKSRPYLVSISNEKYNYFLRYLAFFGGKRGPKPKNGEVRSQVSTTFSEVPPSGLTHGERISVVAPGKLDLFQLYCRFLVSGHTFLTLGQLLGATRLIWKKTD